MSRTLILDSATTIEGISDTASNDDISTYLVQQGYTVPDNLDNLLFNTEESKLAREEALDGLVEFDPNIATGADWVRTTMEIGPAMAASIPAAARAGQFSSNVALVATGNPAVAGVAGLLGGLAASAAVTWPLVSTGRYSGEAAEAYLEGREFDHDEAFAHAVDAANTAVIADTVFGAGFAAAGKAYRVGKTAVMGKAGLADEQIDLVKEVQKELRELDSTLMPHQLEPSRFGATLTSKIAKVSMITQGTVTKLLQSYDDYMGLQTKHIISMFKGGTPKEQGEVLQSLIVQTDNAIDAIVAPMYAAISASGSKILVRSREVGQEAAAVLKHQYRDDPKLIKDKFVPQFVYPDGVQRAIKSLEGLPSDLTFQEAHKRLSSIKGQIHDLNRGTTPNKGLLEVLDAHKKVLEDTMDSAATKLDPSLKKQYSKVTDYYREGQKVVTASYLKQALDVLDPTEIGAILTQGGRSVGLEQIQALKKLAAKTQQELPAAFLETAAGKKLSKELGSTDPMEGIRKGFLESILKEGGEGGVKSVESLRKKLADPQFKETFNALFSSTAIGEKVQVMFDKLDILQRASGGSGAGFQLSIASREIGAMTQPQPIVDKLINILPGFVAKRNLSVKKADEMINMISAATAAQKAGKTLPLSFDKMLNNLLTGLVVSKVATAASTEPMSDEVKKRQEGLMTGAMQQ
tara:strand:+ start:1211 stop:3283 length:2073 start_codon:yes stop_codon:yes gene_type:complete